MGLSPAGPTLPLCLWAMLGWFCSSGIVIHSQSSQILHQSSSAGQECCACQCASCPEVCQDPLPPLWAGSWPGCAAGPIGLGTALSVPVSVLAQGHTWFGCLGSLGPDLWFPLFLKAPISLCTPILCWTRDPVPPLSPGASQLADQEGRNILGGLMRDGRAGTCRFPHHSAPWSFALSVWERTPPSPGSIQLWGVSLFCCRTQCWRSPPGPGAQDKGFLGPDQAFP